MIFLVIITGISVPAVTNVTLIQISHQTQEKVSCHIIHVTHITLEESDKSVRSQFKSQSQSGHKSATSWSQVNKNQSQVSHKSVKVSHKVVTSQ